VAARLGGTGRAGLGQRHADLATEVGGLSYVLVVSLTGRGCQEQSKSEPLERKPAPSDETLKHVARTHETLNSTRPAYTKQLGSGLLIAGQKGEFPDVRNGARAEIRAGGWRSAQRHARPNRCHRPLLAPHRALANRRFVRVPTPPRLARPRPALGPPTSSRSAP